MLLRRFAPLTAALALAAPAISGCSAGDAGVDVADAAAATAKKGTASYSFRLGISGLGLPAKADLRASGVTSLSEPKLTMTTDLAPLLAAFGAPLPTAPIDVRLDGPILYVKPPAIPGITIPGGKEWVSIDLAEAVRSFGLDPDGLAALMAFDPAATLRLVDTAEGMKEIGEETLNGTKTTRFRGTYDIQDVIAALPADRQSAARKALRQIEAKLGDETIPDQAPVDIWLDKDGVLRRMAVNQTIPAGKDAPAGKVSFVYDLTKFGTKLDVGKPASVFDATKPLLEALEGFSSLMAGTLG